MVRAKCIWQAARPASCQQTVSQFLCWMLSRGMMVSSCVDFTVSSFILNVCFLGLASHCKYKCTASTLLKELGAFKRHDAFSISLLKYSSQNYYDKGKHFCADALLLALPQSKMTRLILSDVHPVLGPASGGTQILIEVQFVTYKTCISSQNQICSILSREGLCSSPQALFL